MLPDIGASELMVIALVALIIVGPKDLPLMLRKLGQFTSRLRRMAADFRSSFDDMARQSELEDLRREVEEMRSRATDAVTDPLGVDAAFNDTIEDIDVSMNAPDEPYMTYDPASPAAEEAPAAAAPKPARKAAKKADAAKISAKPTAAAKSAPKKTATAKAAKSGAASRKRPASKIVS